MTVAVDRFLFFIFFILFYSPLPSTLVFPRCFVKCHYKLLYPQYTRARRDVYHLHVPSYNVTYTTSACRPAPPHSLHIETPCACKIPFSSATLFHPAARHYNLLKWSNVCRISLLRVPHPVCYTFSFVEKKKKQKQKSKKAKKSKNKYI